jgi:hypothetical protein
MMILIIVNALIEKKTVEMGLQSQELRGRALGHAYIA